MHKVVKNYKNKSVNKLENSENYMKIIFAYAL